MACPYFEYVSEFNKNSVIIVCVIMIFVHTSSPDTSLSNLLYNESEDDVTEEDITCIGCKSHSNSEESNVAHSTEIFTQQTARLPRNEDNIGNINGSHLINLNGIKKKGIFIPLDNDKVNLEHIKMVEIPSKIFNEGSSTNISSKEISNVTIADSKNIDLLHKVASYLVEPFFLKFRNNNQNMLSLDINNTSSERFNFIPYDLINNIIQLAAASVTDLENLYKNLKANVTDSSKREITNLNFRDKSEFNVINESLNNFSTENNEIKLKFLPIISNASDQKTNSLRRFVKRDVNLPTIQFKISVRNHTFD